MLARLLKNASFTDGTFPRQLRSFSSTGHNILHPKLRQVEKLPFFFFLDYGSIAISNLSVVCVLSFDNRSFEACLAAIEDRDLTRSSCQPSTAL